MLYLGIEKAKMGLTNRQTLSNQGAQSLWAPTYRRGSRVAEKTGNTYDPNDLCRLGHLFLGRGEKMRPPRIYKEETAYYISARASTNELLFRDEGDYLYFLEILKSRKQKYNFRLYGYCLLPGHYHLLIEPDQAESLSKIMQAINTSYSLYFNKKYNRIGHLLSGRFESKMFSKDTTLLEQSIHLHLNPMRLGLAKNLEDYKWSSYFEYVGSHNESAQVVTDKECIFSFIRDTLLVKSEEVSEKYRELVERRALDMQGTGVPVTSHQSPVTSVPFFSRKIRYQVLTAVMLVVLFILPQFFTHQPKMVVPSNNLNKDIQVSLSQGLPFYNTLKIQAVAQAWEVWKLGPFGQGDTDGHN